MGSVSKIALRQKTPNNSRSCWLRRRAAAIFEQLPDDEMEALQVLELATELVRDWPVRHVLNS